MVAVSDRTSTSKTNPAIQDLLNLRVQDLERLYREQYTPEERRLERARLVAAKCSPEELDRLLSEYTPTLAAIKRKAITLMNSLSLDVKTTADVKRVAIAKGWLQPEESLVKKATWLKLMEVLGTVERLPETETEVDLSATKPEDLSMRDLLRFAAQIAIPQSWSWTRGWQQLHDDGIELWDKSIPGDKKRKLLEAVNNHLVLMAELNNS